MLVVGAGAARLAGADGVLQPGDILVRVERPAASPTFEPLEAAARRLHRPARSRCSCSAAASRCTVQLDGRRPGRHHAGRAIVEFGDAVVHDLSYQQARHFNLPMRGVFVANPGYSLAAAGVPRGALITAVNSKPVTNARRFQRAAGAAGRWRARDACATSPSTIRRAAQLQLGAHGPALVSGARAAGATTPPGCGTAATCRRGRRQRRRDRRQRAAARGRATSIVARLAPSLVAHHLRHAVFAIVRHHRAQLPRHRPAWSMRRAGWWSPIATPCRCRWATCA